MPLKYVAQDGSLLLSVNGGLTIFQAAERKPEMLHALAQAGESILLDLSGVDEIDTAGVQLLLLFQREAQHLGKALLVSAMSPAVIAVFDLLQLHQAFGIEQPAMEGGAA